MLHGTPVLVWNARKCQYFFLNFLKIWRGRRSCGPWQDDAEKQSPKAQEMGQQSGQLGQRVEDNAFHPCAELEVDRLLRRRWQSQSPKAHEIDSNVAGRLVRLAGMKIYRGFAERLHHKVPHRVEPGALFHIRIRLERENEQKALTDPPLAQAILDSAKFYQARMRWHITVFLLMPDHLHAVLSFARDKSMSELIRGWKRFNTRANRVMWQEGYFDHRLRADERGTQLSAN